MESHGSYIAAFHQGEDLKGIAPNGLFFFFHAGPGTSRVDPARKPSNSNARASSVENEPAEGQRGAEPERREAIASEGDLRVLDRWGFQGEALPTGRRDSRPPVVARELPLDAPQGAGTGPLFVTH